ncbi:MAG: hypothetical protein ACPGLY_26145 [Rubripirellula sp.]
MIRQDKLASYESIEDELRKFEAMERERLGLEEASPEPWHDPNPQTFTSDQRSSTTMLMGGLTFVHDQLTKACLEGLGYQVEALPVPDTESLHAGKEFGNRGQCNPTYFTVGNLIKYLIHLRDVAGVPVNRIIEDYVFVTVGSCGPCRFGTYVTEYRKALRDSGFDGFRVLLFQQAGGVKQATGESSGLQFDTKFYLQFLRTMIVGDILNALGYRIRPYEVEAGATDQAIFESRQILSDAFRAGTSIFAAMRRCRDLFEAIAVDRRIAKPKVMIIGEFWAMTTEGDGNYRLQRFLEEEGAEVEVQPITAWILYLIWEVRHDAQQRAKMQRAHATSESEDASSHAWLSTKLKIADKAVRGMFSFYARAIGYRGYKLADMDRIAQLAEGYYDVELRGGEGHMEVGKLIECAEKHKCHMVVSVKPFGCMPSSGVSDGIQPAVLAKNPGIIFCPVETTGDAAVNFQSRVQMSLFKAKQQAREEFQEAEISAAKQNSGKQVTKRKSSQSALRHPKHYVACTAANEVYSS